jgi:hypothetical protein
MSAELYCVFDTEAEARAAEATDFELYKAEQIAAGCDCADYWAKTTGWAEVWQRATDGKWVYRSIDGDPHGHIQEEIAEDWKPEPVEV